ncbi:MAG TPA: bifunctional UDP-N-acetylglucosamine diphosphorylase/glucosamine-1-phosphate N-acetyltransferase GlmU [Gaiellales bacterium]|nr:bifunctional UDP-N-acetylglucosamine diphosphorylase/glucosamine-1-phosphate N-acetyltransferase GlmU [Gaiellales bacterium]
MAASLSVTVLAAGKGTRMRNALPKVLHPLAGRALLEHVLAVAAELAPARTLLVLGDDMDEVARIAARSALMPAIVVQDPPLGTGHALRTCAPLLPSEGTVLVLFGDTPLIEAETLRALLAARETTDAAVTVLGMRPADPAGYGRLRTEGGRLLAVVEDADADSDLKASAACNSGVMAFDAARLSVLLDALPLHPASGEYYLTDAVALATEHGWACVAVDGPAEEAQGVNSQAQLAQAAEVIQARLRRRLLEAGVVFLAPDTVQLSFDSEIGPGAVIEPYVVLGPGVRIGAGAHVHSFSYLERSTVAERAEIGPFARLRPGSHIGEGAKVGNFVETKNTTLGPGAKASHLSYLGDTSIGAAANIGAGTITCNYDGFGKYQTQIGAGAFIGSNTALVAPVSVGDGAIIAAGSTITDDVPADGFAVARARQETRAERAKQLREKLRRRKGA